MRQKSWSKFTTTLGVTNLLLIGLGYWILTTPTHPEGQHLFESMSHDLGLGLKEQRNSRKAIEQWLDTHHFQHNYVSLQTYKESYKNSLWGMLTSKSDRERGFKLSEVSGVESVGVRDVLRSVNAVCELDLDMFFNQRGHLIGHTEYYGCVSGAGNVAFLLVLGFIACDSIAIIIFSLIG